MKTVRIVIRGQAPMIQNRVPMAVLLGLLTGEKPPKSKKGSRTTDEIAEEHLYTFGEPGYVGLPLKNMLSCLVTAGRQVRLDGKKQLSTKDSTLLTGMLSLDSEDVGVAGDEPHAKLLTPADGSPIEKWGNVEWVTNIMRGRNPNGGEMVAICRPLITDWAFSLTAIFDDSYMAVDKLRECFDIGGRFVGLCEFRPERKGSFGRYRIDQWEVSE